jgi:hypothetical protein
MARTCLICHHTLTAAEEAAHNKLCIPLDAGMCTHCADTTARMLRVLVEIAQVMAEVAKGE